MQKIIIEKFSARTIALSTLLEVIGYNYEDDIQQFHTYGDCDHSLVLAEIIIEELPDEAQEVAWNGIKEALGVEGDIHPEEVQDLFINLAL